jgi:hypothetical protein
VAELFCTVERNRKKICFADVKTFLQRGNEDDSPVSIEQYNKEIDEALVEAGAGNYITQEEMEKRAAKW